MIKYGKIWYHIVQYDTILYNMISYCTIWYHIVQYDTILYNMIPYCIIWYHIVHDTIFASGCKNLHQDAGICIRMQEFASGCGVTARGSGPTFSAPGARMTVVYLHKLPQIIRRPLQGSQACEPFAQPHSCSPPPGGGGQTDDRQTDDRQTTDTNLSRSDPPSNAPRDEIGRGSPPPLR